MYIPVWVEPSVLYFRDVWQQSRKEFRRKYPYLVKLFYVAYLKIRQSIHGAVCSSETGFWIRFEENAPRRWMWSGHDRVKLYIVANYGKLTRNTMTLVIHLHIVGDVRQTSHRLIISSQQNSWGKQKSSHFCLWRYTDLTSLQLHKTYSSKCHPASRHLNVLKGKLNLPGTNLRKGIHTYILKEHYIGATRAEVGCCCSRSVIWRDESRISWSRDTA
jgi:hypothetical protein